MTTTILMFVAGLVLLVGGAEVLIRGASRLAGRFGVSPLVVGLTVVAFGTSAPEMAVTVGAAATGASQLALGNVVGSNIFNILFVLGLAALFAPLIVARQVVWREVPLLIGLSVVLMVMSLDGHIGRLEGALLFGGLLVYTAWTVWASRKATAAAADDALPPPTGNPAVDAVFIVVGLALLVLGAKWLVDSSVTFARALGVSELVIGLTIVAAGTSLPEVAASVVATLKGERDLAVGNAVGSCIFNIAGVMGLAGLASPGGVLAPAATIAFDLPVMLATAVATLPIIATGHRINRWEGLVFLGYYAAYLAYTVLAAQQHDALHGFTDVMLWYVMPLTALTLVVVLLAEARKSRMRS